MVIFYAVREVRARGCVSSPEAKLKRGNTHSYQQAIQSVRGLLIGLVGLAIDEMHRSRHIEVG
jgi:hypothetical protein